MDGQEHGIGQVTESDGSTPLASLFTSHWEKDRGHFFLHPVNCIFDVCLWSFQKSLNDVSLEACDVHPLRYFSMGTLTWCLSPSSGQLLYFYLYDSFTTTYPTFRASYM